MNDDYLMHYGVIGMHWGVRRYQDYNGKIKKLSPSQLKGNTKQRRGAVMYDRLTELKKDKDRMSRMSDRQKKSLDAATKYWKKRSEGGEVAGRNIIKRWEDIHRSQNFKTRATDNVISSFATSLTRVFNDKEVGYDGRKHLEAMDVGMVGIGTIESSAVGLGVNELQDKIFGHF